MKKTIAMFLMLAMIAGLFLGCGKKDQKEQAAVDLTGTWEGTLDMTQVIRSSLGSQMAGLEVPEFAVKAVFVFAKDGTYTMELDKTSAEEAFGGLLESIKTFVKAELSQQAEEAGLTDMLDAYVDEQINAMVMENGLEAAVEQMVANSVKKGNYQVKGDKLYRSTAPDEEINEDVYEVYTLEGDVLTLTAAHGGEDGTDIIKAVYPVVLKKVS